AHIFMFFFFSSRRRHTRSKRDWSSDVCSSDLSRTLGTLTENGIPLLRSLDLLAEIAGNRYIEKKLTEVRRGVVDGAHLSAALARSEEHTSELQSRFDLVCRLLLEKKNHINNT